MIYEPLIIIGNKSLIRPEAGEGEENTQKPEEFQGKFYEASFFSQPHELA